MSKSSSLLRDLIIIADASITDIDQLLDRVVPGAEVWRIDAGKDILGVLRSAISSGFERLHLLGHGKLGWIHFNSQALGADDFASLAGSNADGAPSLHFWSCKTGLGKQGRDFVDGLSKAFNTVVTAFSGLVGAKERGGSRSPNVFSSQGVEVSVPFTDTLAFAHTLADTEPPVLSES